MARNSTLKHQRDQYILERFRYHRKRNPKWTIMAVIEQTAEDVFLSPATVNNILKSGNEKKIPCTATVSKWLKQPAA